MILSWSEYIWNHYWKPLIHSVFSFCLLRNVHKPSMFLRPQILCLGWSLYTNHWLHRNCWWRWCQKKTLNYHPPREFLDPNMKTLWLFWCWNSTIVHLSLRIMVFISWPKRLKLKCDKNVRAWLSIVSYLKNLSKIPERENNRGSCLGFACWICSTANSAQFGKK